MPSKNHYKECRLLASFIIMKDCKITAFFPNKKGLRAFLFKSFFNSYNHFD